MRTRTERRIASKTAKNKARNLIANVWKLDHKLTPRFVGITATMHGTCPCGLCSHRHREPDVRHRFDPKLHEPLTSPKEPA